MFKKERLTEASLSALGGRPVRSEMELAGRYARVFIIPGRPVMVEQLMDTPESLITRKIRPGYRAVTIELTRVSGLEGWGVPGTRVDVIWVSSAEAKEQFVTTIVKGAQILSVAGKTEIQNANQVAPALLASRGPPSLPALGATSPNQESVFTVTLLVTPEDGQKIFLASRSGELSLMLHGDYDGPQDISGGAPFTTKRLTEGISNPEQQSERVEGMAKARRSDGSIEEWSVIEGRVWRWDQVQDASFGQHQ
jgi:Flp pilus assembly protein CpaB